MVRVSRIESCPATSPASFLTTARSAPTPRARFGRWRRGCESGWDERSCRCPCFIRHGYRRPSWMACRHGFWSRRWMPGWSVIPMAWRCWCRFFLDRAAPWWIMCRSEWLRWPPGIHGPGWAWRLRWSFPVKTPRSWWRSWLIGREGPRARRAGSLRKSCCAIMAPPWRRSRRCGIGSAPCWLKPCAGMPREWGWPRWNGGKGRRSPSTSRCSPAVCARRPSIRARSWCCCNFCRPAAMPDPAAMWPQFATRRSDKRPG